MLAILSHFLRYSIWAVVGAALVCLLFYLRIVGDPELYPINPSPAFALLPIVAGIALVLARVFVGIVTCCPAREADRLTVQGLAQFLFGWILGRLALHLYLSVAHLNTDLSPMLLSGWLEVAFRLSGAVAMVATGWLAFRRHGRFLLPISWLAIFAILASTSVVAWLSYHEELSRLLKSIYR